MSPSPTTQLRCIGRGNCGSVWAAPIESGLTQAIKREDCSPKRSVLKDYNMHLQIINSLHGTTPSFALPHCHEYVSFDDESWWSTNPPPPRFPSDYQACNALISERIPPFPTDVRETLIEEYCPDGMRHKIEEIKADEANEDCLIRPYLGRRRRQEQNSRFKSFSLRNFPLHLDQLEHLNLDAALYARIMAETLAHLYWRAHIDANDIKFVLAPPGADLTSHPDTQSAPSSTIHSEKLGEHVIWLLDFDLCNHMDMDEEGVQQAVRAFWNNPNPFFPRPGRERREERALWEGFRKRFLDASREIGGEDSGEWWWARLWVDRVEEGRTRGDVGKRGDEEEMGTGGEEGGRT